MFAGTTEIRGVVGRGGGSQLSVQIVCALSCGAVVGPGRSELHVAVSHWRRMGSKGGSPYDNGGYVLDGPPCGRCFPMFARHKKLDNVNELNCLRDATPNPQVQPLVRPADRSPASAPTLRAGLAKSGNTIYACSL